jgi:hypothetical protein
MQVPSPIKTTVAELTPANRGPLVTLHIEGVSEMKVMGNPEEAVAVIVKGDSVNILSAMGPN